MLFRKSSVDYMLVGLGNPGPTYARTRHNVGFRCIDTLAAAEHVTVDRLKHKALTCLTTIAERRVLLVKPMTYMNLSGQAVRPLADYYKIPPERIIVMFDDISLPVGRLRVRAEGSAGGHNGLKSIVQELQSQAFPRVKVGVGQKPHPDYDLADWVLSTFSAQEEKALVPVITGAGQAALEIMQHGCQAAANLFNGKTQ